MPASLSCRNFINLVSISTKDNIWMRKQLVAGDWKSVAEYFCSLKPSDLERIHDLTEMLLMELSQLCGEFALKACLIFKEFFLLNWKNYF